MEVAPGELERAGYERWWGLVSEQFDRDVPFALGVDDRPVTLTTHDIRNESGNTAFKPRRRPGLPGYG